MANRIQIINWRKHGADESYCITGVFAADDEADLETAIREEIDGDAAEEAFVDAEEREDYEHTYYVNDDITIQDGDEVLAHNGRKFRITITEVKE